jgi:hypothetical protein
MFVFAEYCTWYSGFAVTLGTPGTSVVHYVDGLSIIPIAPSFAAFWRLYLFEPHNLYPEFYGPRRR